MNVDCGEAKFSSYPSALDIQTMHEAAEDSLNVIIILNNYLIHNCNTYYYY